MYSVIFSDQPMPSPTPTNFTCYVVNSDSVGGFFMYLFNYATGRWDYQAWVGALP